MPSDSQSSVDEVYSAIRSFLATSPEIGLSGDIGRETPLLDGGRLDSLGILQLMMFLGEKLGIEIQDEDFTPENFQTVGSLADFVLRKKQA